MTPLVRADRLADELGFTGALWVKDDSANPTHSFKDRVVSLAATAAKGFGLREDRLRLDRQPGQLGGRARRPRRAARRSSSCPRDLEPGKIVQSAVYGQTLVAVDGSYDDVNRLTSELAETDEFEDTAFVNQNVRPYYAEGSKTMGYEIAEQLGWRIPAQVVIPMASGSLLTKVDKACRELVAAGIVEDTEWTIFGAQSAGCDPIATAFDNGWDVVKPVKPTGIAKSLNIGNPADGPVRPGRRSGAPAASVGRVGDDEIVPGHPRPRPHHRRLRRDRRRGDRRGAAPAGRATAGWTRPRRPSSSTPARGSRPSTRWSRSSGPPTGSSRR